MPEGICDGDSVCDAGICVPPPFDCVVSYGGADGQLGLQVTRVFADGFMESAGQVQENAMHEVSDDVAGQDMLVACGGRVHAVAEGSSRILSFVLGPDGSPSLEDELEVPGGGVLRALECMQPGADYLLAFTTRLDGADPQVDVTSYRVRPDGLLDAGAGPFQLPATSSFPDVFPVAVPRRVRTAWNAGASTAYVMFDVPSKNHSHLVALSVDGRSGEFSVEAVPTVVTGIQARLGGIAFGGQEAALVLTGGQTGDAAGVGNFARFDSMAAAPTFTEVRDTNGDAFFADSTSVVFVEGGQWPEHALVGSNGRFGYVELGDDAGPQLVHVEEFPGAGKSTALTAHGGGVVVVVDDNRVYSMDATTLGTPESGTVNELQHGVGGYTTSVVMRCGGLP